jgi:hypothetical protein
MNVVDSSGWLEYFAGGENAGFFAGPLADSRRLIGRQAFRVAEQRLRRPSSERERAAAVVGSDVSNGREESSEIGAQLFLDVTAAKAATCCSTFSLPHLGHFTPP